MGAKWTFSLCMGIFATIPLFVRMVPLQSAEIALWRAVLASLCIFAFFALRGKKLALLSYRKQMGRLLLSGAIMGINWVTLFESYRYTTVSTATLMYYTAPIMVTAASALLMREKISRFQALCMGLVMLGLGLIVNPAQGAGLGGWLGIALALVSAVLYATVIMMNRMIMDVPGVQRTLLQFAAAILVLLPYVLLNGGLKVGEIDPMGLLSLLTIGAVHTGLAYCLYFGAIQAMKGREIAILSYIDPVLAVLLSALFLHEKLTALQLLGGCLILVFTFLSERKSPKKIESPEVA